MVVVSLSGQAQPFLCAQFCPLFLMKLWTHTLSFTALCECLVFLLSSAVCHLYRCWNVFTPLLYLINPSLDDTLFQNGGASDWLPWRVRRQLRAAMSSICRRSDTRREQLGSPAWEWVLLWSPLTSHTHTHTHTKVCLVTSQEGNWGMPATGFKVQASLT